MRSGTSTMGLLLVVSAMMLASCVIVPTNSHVNVSSTDRSIPPPRPSSATWVASDAVRYDLDWRCRNTWNEGPPARPAERCREDASRRDPNFIGLALSGGGSRAAVFSAAVMFELQQRGLLQQVDVISSVSGGSVTAALYAASCDEEQACPPPVTPGISRTVWKESVVFPLLQQNFIDRWRINCWRPDNVVRYATYFDRTDVMAQTFSETLFGGTRDMEASFLFRDLNPRRPYLILNATNNTDSVAAPGLFAFTEQGFSAIGSRLDLFPLAYGVTGSAAFPGAFHYMTLRNFNRPGEKYTHLMDGGVMDNLGLESLRRVLERGDDYRDAHVLVILADVKTSPDTNSEADPDPRKFLDYFVDLTNIKDTYSMLMAEVPRVRVREFREFLKGRKNGKLVHLRFEDLKSDHPELYRKLDAVPTNFRICDENAESLRQAAAILVGRAVDELRGDLYWRILFN